MEIAAKLQSPLNSDMLKHLPHAFRVAAFRLGVLPEPLGIYLATVPTRGTR